MLELRQTHVGDCRELLRQLPDDSVHCVVTSPPYWGLRDYGTGRWEGGDPGCAHAGKSKPRQDTSGGTGGRFKASRGTQASKAAREPIKSVCRCGARRVDQQIGLEDTPDEFVAALVDVFRQVRRVLRPDGTCWIDIGDSYAGAAGGGTGLNGWMANKSVTKAGGRMVREKKAPGLKPKDMVGIPWTLALALRADGWWLRSEIIWHKVNPLPESVQDRPCRDHEQIFLLTKSAEYFYDPEAVKEPTTGGAHARASTRRQTEGAGVHPKTAPPGTGTRANASFNAAVTKLVEKRNMRTVWRMTGYQYEGAHFATFPPELAQRCILAGCPAGGIVLDPFGGSGTVGEVAEALGRRWILFELNPAYAELAAKRTAQRGLFVEVAR